MTQILFFLFLFFPTLIFGQHIDFNDSKGKVANGYDLTEYFNGKAVKGSSKFLVEHGGTKFQFANSKNAEKFNQNPEKYIPKYGGWCAYAMAKTGEKVTIDPETYEIRDGKLYLFYNAFFTNTLEKWREEGAEELRLKADENWEKLFE